MVSVISIIETMKTFSRTTTTRIKQLIYQIARQIRPDRYGNTVRNAILPIITE